METGREFQDTHTLSFSESWVYITNISCFLPNLKVKPFMRSVICQSKCMLRVTTKKRTVISWQFSQSHHFIHQRLQSSQLTVLRCFSQYFVVFLNLSFFFFFFEIIISSHAVARKSREILCTLHPFFPDGNCYLYKCNLLAFKTG